MIVCSSYRATHLVPLLIIPASSVLDTGQQRMMINGYSHTSRTYHSKLARLLFNRKMWKLGMEYDPDETYSGKILCTVGALWLDIAERKPYWSILSHACQRKFSSYITVMFNSFKRKEHIPTTVLLLELQQSRGRYYLSAWQLQHTSRFPLFLHMDRWYANTSHP